MSIKTKASQPGSQQKTTVAGLDQKWWVLIAVGIGTFMSALDGSVVNISLPVISREFSSGVARVEWVVTIYLLVVSGLLLSFGRLGDLRGHKPVYLLGFLIFVASSALCGLSWNVEALVGFRALQALGGAMLMSNSPAILTKSFPAEQRGQALGMQATMTYLGLTVGPSLGGWLTTQFSWRAVFYINIPVGLLAIWASLRFIPKDEAHSRSERFDLLGAGLFMGGLVSLLLGLNQGHVWGWASPAILALLAVSAALLWAFLYVEKNAHAPMLDLSLFQKPVFSLSVVSAVLNYICVNSILFLMPFYLIQARGMTSAEAGLLLTAQPIIMAIVAPLSGTLSDRVGPRLPGVVGMALLAGGLFLLSRLGPLSSTLQIASALAVAGLGTGIFISPNNSALMGAAPRQRQGIAAGILATTRNVGMVLGIGLAGAIFTTLLSQAGIDPNQVSPSAGEGLYRAFNISFLVAAAAGVAGTLTSLIRE